MDKGHNKGHVYGKEDMKKKASGKRPNSSGSSSSGEDVSNDDVQINIYRNRGKLSGKDGSPLASGLKYSESSGNNLPGIRPGRTTRNLMSQVASHYFIPSTQAFLESSKWRMPFFAR